MEVLAHLIFQIVKVSILGCLYATLVLMLFIILGRINPNNYFGVRLKSKKKIWWSSGFIISISLFIYMFTYWGDHGLGDSARIPIGHFKEVEEINGIEAYIEPKNYPYGAMVVDSFAITKNYLVGKSKSSPVDKPKTFFSWDLSKDEIDFFNSKSDFEIFASSNKLPMPADFRNFRELYREHWSGLKFWLLP